MCGPWRERLAASMRGVETVAGLWEAARCSGGKVVAELSLKMCRGAGCRDVGEGGAAAKLRR